MEEKVKYWLISAARDWEVAGHLLEKRDYAYALFFGHLALEKVLKACYVKTIDGNPPLTHRLVYLAEKTGLELSDERMELLEIVTDFNLEARYPDEKFSFYKRCTREFTALYLDRIEEMKEWLVQKMKLSKIS